MPPAPNGSTVAVVRQLCLEANEVISVVLTAADGRSLPGWEPGAHINLTLPNGVTRQYSLCGNPTDTATYRIGVLREQASTGGSEYVHSFLRPGQPVHIDGPRNHFELELHGGRYIFLAGGIGITPILPMIGRVAEHALDWTLYYGGRSLASMAFLDELRAYGSHVITVPQDIDGHLPLAEVLAESDPDTAVYACGPRPMLDAVAKASQHWPEDSIHTERFGASTGATEHQNYEHVLRCARSDKVVTVPPESTFLRALENAGIKIPHSCQNGICGTCEVGVISGEPEHRDDILSGSARKTTSRMYVCVSRAVSTELTLDL
jgi:ferredoxin-NADP reductase